MLSAVLTILVDIAEPQSHDLKQRGRCDCYCCSDHRWARIRRLIMAMCAALARFALVNNIL